METREAQTDDYRPNDYTIERWIAALLGLLLFLPWIAYGQETDKAALLLRTGDTITEVPAVRTEVSIKVTGPVVRTRVQQTFKNTTGRCAEGTYIYPLPEMSSVDTLKMTLGTRVIAGEIKEKLEAQRAYQQAKSEGRKAALVVQHRPNVFTTAVASLMPDEDAVIELEYQETAQFVDGEYRLRFPMVVAPRYTPLTQVASLVPDVLMNRTRSNVSLSVAMQPGYRVREIRSPFHQVSQQTVGNNEYQLAIDQQDFPSDRDFELSWKPELGEKPGATVLTEKIGDQTYGLILITPPDQSSVRVARDTIFIIDSSGSMEGASMEQAKEALLLALDDLRAGDTFNIVDFDSTARSLFPESRPASADFVEQARLFVRSLSADGGTEMLGAMQLALPGPTPIPGTVRQVIFMTDGQVGNEQQLFEYIHQNLGESRLFTVGIGSAPNSHFMRNAARFGRGTFTYIGDLTQVRDRMGELFAKLGSPVLTSIDVRVDDPTAEMWPQRVPDLYRGEPLLIAVRLTDPSAPIRISGRSAETPWNVQLSLPEPREESGINRMWARHKIESLMDRLSSGADPQAVRSEVVPVALRHHLVSQYTSLVAIDQTPAGLTNGACEPEMLPVESNGGGAEEGSLPQTATPAQLLILIGISLMAVSSTLWRMR